MKQDYKHLLSDVAAQQAQVELDQTNFDRQSMLIKSGTTSQAVYDQAKYALQNDTGKLASLRQQAAMQLAKLGGSADIPTDQHPQYLQARRKSTKRSGNSITPWLRHHLPVRSPTCPPSPRQVASRHRPRRSIWSIPTTSGSMPTEGTECHLCTRRPIGRRHRRYLSGRGVADGTVESVSPAAAQEFALLPRRTPAVTGSKSCSACRCACAST